MPSAAGKQCDASSRSASRSELRSLIERSTSRRSGPRALHDQAGSTSSRRRHRRQAGVVEFAAPRSPVRARSRERRPAVHAHRVRRGLSGVADPVRRAAPACARPGRPFTSGTVGSTTPPLIRFTMWAASGVIRSVSVRSGALRRAGRQRLPDAVSGGSPLADQRRDGSAPGRSTRRTCSIGCSPGPRWWRSTRPRRRRSLRRRGRRRCRRGRCPRCRRGPCLRRVATTLGSGVQRAGEVDEDGWRDMWAPGQKVLTTSLIRGQDKRVA